MSCVSCISSESRVPILMILLAFQRHTLQFWDATEAPRNVTAVKLENEKLKWEIIPQWGGKVHSLTHKSTGAPLLLENNVHMPSTLPFEKPFASGGIEWNWGGGRGQINRTQRL